MDFIKQIQRITYVYNCSDEQAACYLSNYEDEYICHKHNGGCKNSDMCGKISKDERKSKKVPDELLISMEDQIIERFIDRLKGLAYGFNVGENDIALICYEKPSDFYHRHLVSEWLKQNGYKCKEWRSK